jgi:hypothetical protein
MMTVEEVTDDDLFKRMSSAYDQVVAVLDGHKLDRDEGFSLMAQILCQLSHDNREDFIWKMDKFYSMERFLRPQPTEVH